MASVSFPSKSTEKQVVVARRTPPLLDKLPSDLIYRTFQNFSRRELASLRTVCKIFQELSNEESLCELLQINDPYKLRVCRNINSIIILDSHNDLVVVQNLPGRLSRNPTPWTTYTEEDRAARMEDMVALDELAEFFLERYVLPESAVQDADPRDPLAIPRPALAAPADPVAMEDAAEEMAEPAEDEGDIEMAAPAEGFRVGPFGGGHV